MSDFFTSRKASDLVGPAVSCPSCKVPNKELYCSTCIVEAIKRESTLHDAQKTSRDHSKRILSNFLRDNMDSATLAFDTNHLEGENDKMRQLVDQTRMQIAQIRDLKKDFTEKLERRKRELASAKERMAKARTYDQDVVEPIVRALEQAGAELEETVASERRKKMEHLLEVFPLDPVKSTIAGVPLALDFQSNSEDPQNALALALVARVVILSAHYLRIPLAFHLIYERGEAWVEHRGSLVHLQRRLRNLYLNVKTLCVAQGVPSNVLNKVDFIESLWQLFHSPSLGRSIGDAMTEGEMRENKLLLRRAESITAPSVTSSQTPPVTALGGGLGTAGGGGTRAKSKKAKKREEDDDFVLVMS